MELALIGLGKMGLNMATRLVRGGHKVVGYARTKESVDAAIANGAEGASSLEDAIGKLTSSPKVVWVMVPSGKITTETIEKVASFLNKGDIIVDGGNSNCRIFRIVTGSIDCGLPYPFQSNAHRLPLHLER